MLCTKQPMLAAVNSFQQIQSLERLSFRQGATDDAMCCEPGHAWADIQLVWSNCRTFNAAASPICSMAAESEKALTRKWAAAGLPGPVAAAAAPPSEPGLPKGKAKKVLPDFCSAVSCL